MVRYKQIKLFLLLLTVSYTTANAISSKTTTSHKEYLEETKNNITLLENEKVRLLKQINEAINDSVRILNESNDSDSQVGIGLMKKLQEQLVPFNETNNTAVEGSDGDSLEVNDTRRIYLGHKKPDLKHIFVNLTPKTTKRSKLFTYKEKYFTDELYEKKNLKKKYGERYKNREDMRERVKEWLTKKDEEKLKKKRKNRASSARLEKCFRFGKTKPKKDKKWKGFSGNYGCCRKCCKFSDLGCL